MEKCTQTCLDLAALSATIAHLGKGKNPTRPAEVKEVRDKLAEIGKEVQNKNCEHARSATGGKSSSKTTKIIQTCLSENIVERVLDEAVGLFDIKKLGDDKTLLATLFTISMDERFDTTTLSEIKLLMEAKLCRLQQSNVAASHHSPTSTETSTGRQSADAKSTPPSTSATRSEGSLRAESMKQADSGQQSSPGSSVSRAEPSGSDPSKPTAGQTKRPGGDRGDLTRSKGEAQPEESAEAGDGESTLGQTTHLQRAGTGKKVQQTPDRRTKAKKAKEGRPTSVSAPQDSSPPERPEAVVPHESIATFLEEFKDYVVELSTIREMYSHCLFNPITILTDDTGTGKSTMASMLRRYAKLSGHFETKSYTCTDFQGLTDHEGKPRFVSFDNFFGHTTLDFYGSWSTVIDRLREVAKVGTERKDRYLLVTRRSVLDAALASTGTSLRCILGRGNTVTLKGGLPKICEKLLKGRVELRAKALKDPPCIGSLVSCKLLAGQKSLKVTQDIFSRPRSHLKEIMRNIISKSDIVKAALCLLAVEDTAVDTSKLQSGSESERYSKILESVGSSKVAELGPDIMDFCKNSPDLVHVKGPRVTFSSAALREAALMALCDSHPRVLANFCSVRTLSRLAALTSDAESQADAAELQEKPRLSEEAKLCFLQRIQKEVAQREYRYAFTSDFFKHDSFLQNFLKENILENAADDYDDDCYSALFWAGANSVLFQKMLLHVSKGEVDVIKTGLVACCYWGLPEMLPELLKRHKYLKNMLQKAFQQSLSLGDNMSMLHRKDTPLTLAAWRGKDAVVRWLLEEDRCPFDLRGKDNQTALMHYCAQGNRSMVTHLLTKADPNLVDALNMTALHYAVSREEWSIPEKLLTPDNINAPNGQGETPLLLACQNGWSPQAIQRLIEAGAKPRVLSCGGLGCVHAACRLGSPQLLEFLLKRGDFLVAPSSQGDGDSPLETTVSLPNRDAILRRLLQEDSMKKEAKRRIDEYVAIACGKSDLPTLKELLRAGRPRPAVFQDGSKAAHKRGAEEMATFLKGPSVESHWHPSLATACSGKKGAS